MSGLVALAGLARVPSLEGVTWFHNPECRYHPKIPKISWRALKLAPIAAAREWSRRYQASKMV